MSTATFTLEPATVESIRTRAVLKNELDILEKKYGAPQVRAVDPTDQIDREKASTAGETYFSDRMAAYMALKSELTVLRGRYGTANVEAAMQARAIFTTEAKSGWFSRVWDYVREKADKAVAYLRRVGPVEAATTVVRTIVQWTSILLSLAKAVKGMISATSMLFSVLRYA